MRDYLNDEQRQLADSLERYLEREHPIPESGIPCCAAGQPISASGHWGEFANFGLLALTVDESRGGIQDDPIAVHAIMEHFGRHLVLEPYVATVVQAASLLAATGTEQLASELLALVLAGDCQIAMAHAEEQTDYSLHNVSTRAEVLEQDGCWTATRWVFVMRSTRICGWCLPERGDRPCKRMVCRCSW